MSRGSEPAIVTVLHQKGMKDGLPISGTFELTERCNFNCEMCYVHDLKIKKDPLSAKDWINLGEQIKEAGTLFLLLTGGEPLLRDDFEEIYTALYEMGFMISVNTNGSLVDKYIELFKKYPPTRFNISLYGSDEEGYKSICKVNKFHKVVENIKLLEDNNIDVKINMVLTPANERCWKGIIDITKDLNIHMRPTAYSFPQIRLGMHQDDVRFTAEKAAYYTWAVDEYRMDEDYVSKKLKSTVALPQIHMTDKVRCRAGKTTFWVTAEGQMRACGMMPCPTDIDPLKEGFPKAWERVKEYTDNIRLPKECITCEYSGICSVCAAMVKAETGEFDKKPEYICKMTKEMYRLAREKLKEKHNEY